MREKEERALTSKMAFVSRASPHIKEASSFSWQILFSSVYLQPSCERKFGSRYLAISADPKKDFACVSLKRRSRLPSTACFFNQSANRSQFRVGLCTIFRLKSERWNFKTQNGAGKRLRCNLHWNTFSSVIWYFCATNNRSVISQMQDFPVSNLRSRWIATRSSLSFSLI